MNKSLKSIYKEVLFINGELGLRVLEYILSVDSEIVLIFINSRSKQNKSYKKLVEEKLMNYAKNVEIVEWNKEEILNYKEKLLTYSGKMVATSALFGHIIPEMLLKVFEERSLNLHPSLLPSGKGAHPIPWAIIDGVKQGVSIHIINERLDEGDVIFQKEIETTSALNASAIYDLCMNELFFGYLEVREFFGKDKTFPKEIGKNRQYLTSFHKSRDLDGKSIIHAHEIDIFSNFVKLIQANDFGARRSIKYIDESGKIWSLKLLFENYINSSEVI